MGPKEIFPFSEARQHPRSNITRISRNGSKRLTDSYRCSTSYLLVWMNLFQSTGWPQTNRLFVAFRFPKMYVIQSKQKQYKIEQILKAIQSISEEQRYSVIWLLFLTFLSKYFVQCVQTKFFHLTRTYFDQSIIIETVFQSVFNRTTGICTQRYRASKYYSLWFLRLLEYIQDTYNIGIEMVENIPSLNQNYL